jgi:hypothetical protein
MEAREELEKLAGEHEEVAGIVEELDFVKRTFDTEIPSSELEELVKYLKIRFDDCSELKKIEAGNKFKLLQIKKMINFMELEYEEWKEIDRLINHLEQLTRIHSKVEVLSERLIVNEKFSGLLDEIFSVLMLRAGR